MNWQQFKDQGQQIYKMARMGKDYFLEVDQRVIYINGFSGISTRRCVRFENKWHPLHEPDELKTKYRFGNGTYGIVYIGGKPLKSTDQKLPFIRLWERSGLYYQPYGY